MCNEHLLLPSIDDLQAGKAVFTVSNPDHTHYTYMMETTESENYGKSTYVRLLTGSDNTSKSSYTYMGVYSSKYNRVLLTKASKYQPDTIAVRVINWALKVLAGEKELPKDYKIQSSGLCYACGRMLTDDKSISAGYGPVCRKRI